MFGSWKSRGGCGVQRFLWRNEEAEVEEDEVDILSEVEEELSTFILRQKAWKDLQHVKDLPCWMKTASLNRCYRTPPLPPKTKPPTPPKRQRSRSRTRLGSSDLPSCSPTPPLRSRRPSSTSTTSNSARQWFEPCQPSPRIAVIKWQISQPFAEIIDKS